MRARTPRSRGARAGFTLVELAVSGTVLFLLLGAAGLVWTRNDRAYSNGSTAALLELRVGVAIDRIVAELAPAQLASLAPDPLPGLGTQSLDFVQAVGFESSAVVIGPPRRIAFELDATEADDGTDDDGDGLVDEGVVVLTIDVGGAEQRVVLASAVAELGAGELANGVDDDGDGLVDEPGFFVERDGETLVVNLTLRRIDANGTALTRVARSAVQIRN
ncbi:MAG TPA: hypothetical protein VJP77_06300 [Planctomycetota bacterium]|nr:hypothetical protein [Planctomycetota bacterium]